MIVAELDSKSLSQSLGNQGISLQFGPFRFLIRSSISAVIDNIAVLYADYLVGESLEPAFNDFHITVKPPSTIRRWYQPQAQFYLDDAIVFNPFPLNHATAMLEWGMNWCVSTQIHTYLVIHAAVVERNGFAAVLPAPPGAGKSTLCASLVQEEWRLLSDELTLIDLDTHVAVPMPRPISLKNQSIAIIQQRYSDVVFGQVSSDTLKGSVSHIKPTPDSIHQQNQPVPIAWIIFPQYLTGAKTQLTIKNKGRAFIEIADNAFNYSCLGEVGFDVLSHVVDHAQCYSFSYSDLDEAIAVFNQLASK